MNLKKVIGWAIVIFIGWYVITNPHAAASTVNGIKTGLGNVASSLTAFLTSL